MPRRRANPIPQSANLTVDDMRNALSRLERRLDDLRAFDPDKVKNRDDPKIRVLGNAIDDFLTGTFGYGTVEFKRYATAKIIDTAPINFGHPIPMAEVIQGLHHGKEKAIGILEGIQKNFEEEIELAAPEKFDEEKKEVHANPKTREVFIIHGTDHGTRAKVARFLEKLELSPIILDEAANKGRTIHQKFRDHSRVAFAVALFTPDDVGRPADDSAPTKPRPRQNVVYELGYFSAKLGDGNVCVLHSNEVEIPSDLSGVVYIPLDHGDAWKLQLAKELNAAGLKLNINKIIED